MAMKCDPCGKSFTGIVSYNQHIESDKHQRKVSLHLFQNRNAEQQQMKESNIIPCHACNLSFNTNESFQIHAMTLEHAANLSKKLQNDSYSSSRCSVVSSTTENDKTSIGSVNKDAVLTNTTSGNINDAILPSTHSNHLYKDTIFPLSDDNDSILPSGSSYATSAFAPFMQCKICSKQFSGPEPYKQHLESAGHKKKVEMASFILGSGTNQSVSDIFSCKPCKKIFSGQIPLEQHLISDVHKKKVQSFQLLEKFKENMEGLAVPCDSPAVNSAKISGSAFENMDENKPWFCKICLVQCSGLIPFQQHINGESHWKNKRRVDAAKSYSATDSKYGYASMNAVNASIGNNAAIPTSEVPLETDRQSQRVRLALTSELSAELSTLYQDTESDALLPLAMQNLQITADKINIKEFGIDEKIDFDGEGSKIPVEMKSENEDINNCESKTLMEFDEESTSEGSSSENLTDKEKKIEIYKECKLCSIQFRSIEELMSHLESLEHYKRKWPSN